MEANRYPIGKFEALADLTPEKRAQCIKDIAELPPRLRKTVKVLGKARLDIPYREGGWTPRQIVHHIADSAIHSCVRFKFALAQENPPLLGYDQDVWSAMPDAATLDVEPSLLIMDGLSARMGALLGTLAPADFRRTFIHSERGQITLDFYLQLMAWHGIHHTAQLQEASKA